ncbi:MAG: hypothetical protein ABIZ05_08975 [Pseudonocardiaceae bacterium]
MHASPHDAVRHFLSFAPRDNARIVEKLTYYKGYLAAMEAAPTRELNHSYDWRWYEDLHEYISRCITIYQDERVAGEFT